MCYNRRMSRKSDKMANWPVGRLLFSMGIPAVFSMLIQAMYNVVDSIYISQYSQDGMFAIGLASPFQMIGFSIAMGTAVGVSTLVSRRLGEQRREEANATASTGVILAFLHMLIVVFLGIFVSKPFLRIFTQRAEIVELGYQYLLICMGVSFGFFYSLLFERMLQAQGNMLFPMFAQLLGAVTNIVLDPVFIFGRFGMPEMGVVGAAVATVGGQILSGIFITAVALLGKHEVKLKFRGMDLFEKERLKAIYSVGLPTAIMNMIGSFTTTLMNNILVRFSEEAVTSLSIYFKLQSFVFMPVFGFNQGALPILSYNYGARNAERYKNTVRIYITTAVAIMIAGTLLFNFAPDLILSFFTMTDSLKAISRVTLRIVSLSFVPAACSIVFSTMYQSFGKGVMSMTLSVLRQIGFLIPAAYILANIGLEAVWFSYPIAEVLVVAIFLPLIMKAYKKAFAQAV